MQTTAVVVGAGHAGLAMSRRLTERSIDHLVLERGEVANSWRTQRWPSLRLLTPNWQTRLPGHPYAGDDPDGYMPAAALPCARAVVLATGACTRPAIPGLAEAIPPPVMTLNPFAYRDPGQLPDGGVLGVGASATGGQLAAEIHPSRRPGTL